MGESALPVEGPQPKPSRFQFVPVPGEFTRGRWKCRDSMRPYGETLEFDKGAAEKPNPNLITVTHKFVRSPPIEIEVHSDTIQVTSIDGKGVNITGDKVIVTRRDGVTVIRKGSNVSTPEKKESNGIIPPTPMNTPPASMVEPGILVASRGDSLAAPALSHTNPTLAAKPKLFQVQAVVDSSISQPTRKFSHENAALQRGNISQSSFANVDLPQSYSATVPAKPRVFQIQTVPETALASPTPSEKEEVKKLDYESNSVHNTSLDDTQQFDDTPTFQVIQTEACKNISMDSIDLQSRDFAAPDVVSRAEDVQTPTGVMITVSTSNERREILKSEMREVASSASSLDACGIPISGATPNAPHSTPYGTPKDTQRSPTFTSAVDDVALTTAASAPVLPSNPVPSASVSDASVMPIDNKIEQAMELVKTHLTYAVREEVDTLKNTIQDLDYQLKEYQYECQFYRQSVSQEMVDQAAAFARQQMQKHQPPARRSVSTAGVTDSSSQSTIVNNNTSPHMRNLQTQIQQMKQTHPSTRKNSADHN